MKSLRISIFIFLVLCGAGLSGPAFSQKAAEKVPFSTIDYETFRVPPMEYRGIRWMGYNLTRLSDSVMIRSIKNTVDGKMWGTYLLGPGGGPTTGLSEEYLKESRRAASTQGVPYLSEEYFRIYKRTIEEGVKYGLNMTTLYDEWGYPSGLVGGQFYSKYPDDIAKSLDLTEVNVSGPQTVTLKIPQGKVYSFVGAVMMNLTTFERRDVSSLYKDSILTCKIPKGEWKVMGFYLNGTFRPNSVKGGFVDYLDKAAVAKYIKLNFDPYYTHLKEFFGTVIKRTIYDEPCLYLSDGRMWTPGFNEGFKKKNGYSPMLLYPALWYSIGEGTAAARNALFGYRTELYAENYIGQVAQWCAERGIDFSGHQDQEESRNPVAISGDLMKVFKHQQVPAMDDIYYAGRSNVAYKIVSSACYNYDRPEFMVETYAAYRKLDSIISMRVALDQLTMGVNIQLAVSGKTRSMDEFLGRAGYLLRGGRHVADIAVLYPINSLQAAYSFSGPVTGNTTYYAYEGGIIPPETDYMDIGERLFRGLRLDYTYLHPEILAEKCTIEGNKLVLNNKVNREEFKVLIVPGGDVMSVLSARQILEFYRKGGTVIATSKLPTQSAEMFCDKEIKDMVREVFGISNLYPMTAGITLSGDQFTTFFRNTNAAGGRGFFIQQPNTQILKQVLNLVIPVKDVDIQLATDNYVKMTVDYEGGVTYIHKVKDGRNVYFIANSTNVPVSTKVAFRTGTPLEVWNPHTGQKQSIEQVRTEIGGQAVTTVSVALDPVSSLFFMDKLPE